MLSIIICSREKKIKHELAENIDKTIGTEYELIIVDNSLNSYSIFEAYNYGISQSNGNYLCFIHDDIFFHTQNWGNVIENIFESDSKIGLVGVAGAKIKTKMPSAWWDCNDENLQINIIQHFSDKKEEHWQKGLTENNTTSVAAIDGVFMAARKDAEITFSTELKGFHNYDLNFSFEYQKKGYKVVTTKEILLEHYSLGTLNKDWYSSTIRLHKLYKEILPLNFSNTDMKKIEFKNGSKFILDLLNHKMKKEALSLWFQLIWLKPKSKFHFKFLNQFFK